MLLPVNKPKEKDITPKVFFIWGQSMSGKTYLARQFPNPLIINTDGNAKKVDTPSVEVYDFETFVKVLEEKVFYMAEEYHQDYAIKNPKEMQKELEESGRIKK